MRLPPKVVRKDPARLPKIRRIQQRQRILVVHLIHQRERVVPDYIEPIGLYLRDELLDVRRLELAAREGALKVQQPAVEAIGFCDIAQEHGVEELAFCSAVEDVRDVRGATFHEEGAEDFSAVAVAGVDPWGGRNGDEAVREVDEGRGKAEVFGGVGTRGACGEVEEPLGALGREVGTLEVVAED